MLSTTARVAVMALPALVQALSISPSPYEVTISGRVSTIQIPIPQLRTFTTTITQASTTVTQTNAIAESIETTTIVLTGAVPVVTSIAGLIPQSARLAASSVAPGTFFPASSFYIHVSARVIQRIIVLIDTIVNMENADFAVVDRSSRPRHGQWLRNVNHPTCSSCCSIAND